MNENKVLNFLQKVSKCPICKKKKFNNLGKIKKFHNNSLQNKLDLIQCYSCRHAFISKMPNQNILNNLYKSGSSSFLHGDYKSKSLIKEKFKKKNTQVKIFTSHWIYQYCKDYKPKRYFDVGPGNCGLLNTFKHFGWKCEGYELQNWIKGKGIYNNFNKIPKNNKDVLVFDNILEHVVDPEKYLKTFSKFQKSKSKLFLSFPNITSTKGKIFKSNWSMVIPLAHLNFFSIQSTKIMLEKSGYKPILIKTHSLVGLKKLIRSIIRLPITLVSDLIKFDIKKAVHRICEILINILDLTCGDQIHVVAEKK